VGVGVASTTVSANVCDERTAPTLSVAEAITAWLPNGALVQLKLKGALLSEPIKFGPS
jgi:hypothetical protein